MERPVKEFDSLIEVMDDLDALGITGVQRFQAINGFISMKARYKDIPVSGSFELTPLCNFDCKMCYVHLNPDQIKENERLLTVEEWKSIIKQAVDAGMLFATLTGGECLTYPGFKEVYLYLLSLGIRTSVLTNGSLLTEDMVEFFKKYPPEVLQITIYGSNEDVYENVCGVRAFHDVMDGIRRAKEAGLELFFSLTPSRYMEEDAHALVDLVAGMNFPYSINSATIMARNETGRNIENYVVNVDVFFKMLEYNKRVRSASPDIGMKTIPLYTTTDKKQITGLPCGGGHSTFHINWKGEMCPCIGFSSAIHIKFEEGQFGTTWKVIGKELESYKQPEECSKCELSEKCTTCPGEKIIDYRTKKLNKNVCAKMGRTFCDVQ